MKAAILAVAILIGGATFSQTAPKPKAAAAVPLAIPEVPKDQQIQILKLLNEQKDAQLEAASLNARIQQLQTQYHQDDAEIAAAKQEAIAAAKLDPSRYDVDVIQMKFIAKPSVAPEKK